VHQRSKWAPHAGDIRVKVYAGIFSDFLLQDTNKRWIFDIQSTVCTLVAGIRIVDSPEGVGDILGLWLEEEVRTDNLIDV
jgi:hypothetical protein